MKIQKVIGLTTLLLTLVIPAFSYGAGIRQEEYVFRMELTQDLSRKTFVIGDFSDPTPLRPATAIAGKIKHPLAIRVSRQAFLPSASDLAQEKSASDCLMPIVFFEMGSALLSEANEEMLLASLACISQKTPLTVTGFTCDLGAQDLNDHLARQRAATVAEFLRAHGFTVAVIQGKGRSDFRSTDPEQRRLNRRVEITTAIEPAEQKKRS